MPLFHLDWPIYRDYRIEEPAKPKKHMRTVPGLPHQVESSGALLLAGDLGPSIVRKGNSFDVRQPLKLPGLCRKMAEYPKTPEGALKLVSTYGFLFSRNARSERVSDICGAIETARDLVAATDAKEWQRIADWLARAGSSNEHFIHGGIGKLGVQLSIPDGEARPDLRLRPANLYHAALVQLFEEVSSGRPLRPCKRPGCSEWFTYGPGTVRRETARYCSTRCKDAHTYLKRKGSPS